MSLADINCIAHVAHKVVKKIRRGHDTSYWVPMHTVNFDITENFTSHGK